MLKSFLLVWVPIVILGFLNGFYICFSGIKIMDRHFSKKNNFHMESESPYDAFSRMHKYSFLYLFGFYKKNLNLSIRIWLYFTCLSLTAYWATMLFAIIHKTFFFTDPI